MCSHVLSIIPSYTKCVLQRNIFKYTAIKMHYLTLKINNCVHQKATPQKKTACISYALLKPAKQCAMEKLEL